MSTVTESSPETQPASAKPVENYFRMTCSLPEYDVKCTLKVFEELGKVIVSWDLPQPYVLSACPDDKPQGVAINLFGNGNFVKGHRTLERTGKWETGQSWGTGWSAELYGWDWATKSFLTQVATPKTAP